MAPATPIPVWPAYYLGLSSLPPLYLPRMQSAVKMLKILQCVNWAGSHSQPVLLRELAARCPQPCIHETSLVLFTPGSRHFIITLLLCRFSLLNWKSGLIGFQPTQTWIKFNQANFEREIKTQASSHIRLCCHTVTSTWNVISYPPTKKIQIPPAIGQWCPNFAEKYAWCFFVYPWYVRTRNEEFTKF